MKNIYRTLKNKLNGLAKDRRGQTMTEYALLVGFLAAAGAIFLSASGDNVKASFANMGSKLDSAVADSAVADSGGTPVADNSKPSPSASPTPSDTPSGAGDDSGSSGDQGGGDDGGKDKKDKKDKDDKSNNSDNDNGNGNKNGHNK
jgi:Flp pilus assembly pilin Flp